MEQVYTIIISLNIRHRYLVHETEIVSHRQTAKVEDITKDGRREKKEIPRRVAERLSDGCVPFLRRLCEKGKREKKKKSKKKKKERKKGGKKGIKDVKLKSGALTYET